MSSLEVPMSHYVCQWCGCPYSIPFDLASNAAFTRRCPVGHDSSGRTAIDLMREAREERDELRQELTMQSKYLSQLKGQITRLKKAAQRAKKEAA